MGAAVPGHPTRAQPHEGGCKRSSPSLCGCSGTANGIPVHGRGITLQHFEAFDGTKDPVDHLSTYKIQMELHGYQDPVQYRAFAIKLKGSALAWFNKLLPPQSHPSESSPSLSYPTSSEPGCIGSRATTC